ncbi:MAG: DNA repair protein RecO C-terminal domain-containing protein [Bacteroidales bacterium]|nr:DNA repair protein RecO C-terminal domain-containing protein [Bacteroidales bacterium]
MDTDLIVLNLTKLGESSVVLHALSREYGRRSFVVKVSRKTSMSLFLPLNLLEADVSESPRSTLWRAGAVTARHPLNGIRSDMHKNTMTLFMSEVLYRAVKDGAYEAGLFEWLERSILTLDSLERDFSNYHLRFLLELASAMGFSPTAEALAPFSGKYYQLLSDFVRAPFAESMIMPMNGEVRNALAEILLKYIAHHSESSLNIQSLKVLRELYG